MLYVHDDQNGGEQFLRAGTYVSRYESDGTPVGPLDPISIYEMGWHHSPSIAVVPDGRVVVAHASCYFCTYQPSHDYPPDADWDYDIYARVFRMLW